MDEFNIPFFDEQTVSRILCFFNKYTVVSNAWILPNVLRIVGHMVSTAGVDAAMRVFFREKGLDKLEEILNHDGVGF